MMKLHTLLALFLSSIILASCGNGGGSTSNNHKADSPATRVNTFVGGGAGYTTVFIPTDSANKMISSYLQSVDSNGGGSTDSSLHSLIFNADSVREYLSNPAIKHVKVMFAHTLEYINAMGSGHNVGYERGALTVILGGYDEQGNYIFYKTNQVPEHANECPIKCPITGTAANDLFPTNH
ncbi:MAG: hypothetical protein JST06_02265 [Bacteroidetes bacterium]|nr:hypothetical protein [Bacteroidota bacterium]MBS1629346.1 hypothetical protein [Bacteroidota bacterium]